MTPTARGEWVACLLRAVVEGPDAAGVLQGLHRVCEMMGKEAEWEKRVAVAEEREACAKTVEANSVGFVTLEGLARMIRARG